MKNRNRNLWQVEIRYRGVCGAVVRTVLLITTSTKSAKCAVEKAQSVMRREYNAAQIDKVEHQGVIDA